MIHYVVSVKDLAAQVFGRPIFVPHIALALRSFRDEVNRKDSTDDLHRHPEDFELYEVGQFEDALGAVVPCDDVPRLIARAKDLIES